MLSAASQLIFAHKAALPPWFLVHRFSCEHGICPKNHEWTVTINPLHNFMNPSCRSFDLTHLNTCQSVIQLLDHRSHAFHTAGETDLPAMVYHLADRAQQLLYRRRRILQKSESSASLTGRSSTFMPRISFATTAMERRVTEGRMLSDLGMTRVPSLSMKIKFAPPVSLHRCGLRDQGTCFHRSRSDVRLHRHADSSHSSDQP